MNAIKAASPLRLSAVALVAANLVPIFGVLLLDWDVFSLLLLFWLENVYIGLFNVAKILAAAGDKSGARRLFMSAFFVVHYGGFTAGHGFMLLTVFGPPGLSAQLGSPAAIFNVFSGGLWLAALVLFLSHLFSLLLNFFVAGEYRDTTPAQAMVAPYNRILALHATLLIGGLLLQAFGEPVFGLLVLVAVKIAMDLGLHRRSHRQRSRVRVSPAGQSVQSRPWIRPRDGRF